RVAKYKFQKSICEKSYWELPKSAVPSNYIEIFFCDFSPKSAFCNTPRLSKCSAAEAVYTDRKIPLFFKNRPK
ncbi:MAG: hypothetical protein J5449_06690, partial [Oscillospiraceae bacterium]|nr:hypothetical protein [Oscillospiraceae bacterium]